MNPLIDPGKWRDIPRWNPHRLICWTLQNRWYNFYSRLTWKPIEDLIDRGICVYFSERSTLLPDTFVTSRQRDLLVNAVQATEYFQEPVIEIGCYRGTTTRLLASSTNRLVYAVDPFTGYGGSEEDFIFFSKAIKPLTTIRHVRETSGEAFKLFQSMSVSFVFIDAVHDYPNTWFDFTVWGSSLKAGGMIAFHDVDDWPGTNLACRRIISKKKEFVLWGYCPNLAIFRKVRNAPL